MKYIAVFFVAFVAVLTVQMKAEGCLKNGEVLLNGTTIRCIDYHGMTVDRPTRSMYCCESEGFSPSIDSGFEKSKTPYFTCECVSD
ncbi:hypothetical protein PoB_007161800 [Plakobranchus ocellatus]|uniref:Single domain-containing protein n=1 Tax=Plakobranchus ocellatus TaxID=259542 RepID=A0AAV4DM34_9GAST|nr:hypothetical protein PoB_007161800 [Plakobranchus ocellatus]